MKLLLDEMYARAVAEQLRARGHDVVAVTEVDERRGQPDPEIFAWAQAEERAVVTDNVADYMPIHGEHVGAGRPHHGLVLTHDKRFPRGQPATTGRLVTALDQLLAHPPQTASFLRWLEEPR